MNGKINVVAVVGPTASGKTKLSVEIAKHLNGEIISADSMQIYKGMDIATAKPTTCEMQNIPHRLMGFLDTTEKFSVASYVELAHKAINEINNKNKLPIITGGTGLYIDSLLNNIKFSNDTSDENIRKKYQRLYENNGVDFILDVLKNVDIQSYNRLCDERNPKRIIRAIEVFETSGKTLTQHNIESKQTSPYNPVTLGLTCENRELLYDRINRRVDLMLEQGLLEEAKAVLQNDLSETAQKAIGYKELKPYFDRELSLEECIENLKMNTRRYAKRQLTWFRKNSDINWLYIDKVNNFEELLEQSLNIIKTKDF